MAEVVYNTGKTAITTNVLPNNGTNLRAVLLSGTKTGADAPTLATVAAIDAVTSVVVRTERVTLGTYTKAFSGNNIVWDSPNFAFAADSGITALALVIYDATTDTNDTTRLPLAFYDTGFGAGIDVTGGLNVTVTNFLQLT